MIEQSCKSGADSLETRGALEARTYGPGSVFCLLLENMNVLTVVSRGLKVLMRKEYGMRFRVWGWVETSDKVLLEFFEDMLFQE